MMTATYSESTEAKFLKEYNRDIPVATYSLQKLTKPSFEEVFDTTNASVFFESKIDMIVDLIYHAKRNKYELPSEDSMGAIIAACKLIKANNYGVSSYTSLVEGGVSLELKFQHTKYCLLEFYNSGEAVFYLEQPDSNPIALDLDHAEAIVELSKYI